LTGDIKSKDRKEMESTMNGRVLEVAKYPAITFEGAATSATQLSEVRSLVNLLGTLSLHGETGTVPVAAQITLMGDMLRASGDFSISQSSYGIPLVSFDAGTLKSKDGLTFTFDMIARKQD
jgi:polyisoprenoid-binding protein YceI